MKVIKWWKMIKSIKNEKIDKKWLSLKNDKIEKNDKLSLSNEMIKWW